MGDLSKEQINAILVSMKSKTDFDGIVDFCIKHDWAIDKPVKAARELGVPPELFRTITATGVFGAELYKRIFKSQIPPSVLKEMLGALVAKALDKRTSVRDMLAVLNHAAQMYGVEFSHRVKHDVNVQTGIQIVVEAPPQPKEVFTIDPDEVIEVDGLPAPDESELVPQIQEGAREGVKVAVEAPRKAVLKEGV